MAKNQKEMKYYAHVKEITPDRWETHPLLKHLKDTANLAGSFAEIFNNKDWAELSGFWHDLGKYLPDWQAYLCRKSGYSKYDPEAHIETGKGRPNHSTSGAALSFERFFNMINNPERARSIARILGYIISGHHAGLPDNEPPCIGDSLMNRVYKVDSNSLNTSEIDQVKIINEASVICEKVLPVTPPLGKSDAMNHKEHFHLWIRMLFSCLVDADYLDTEVFMKPEQAGLRTKYPELTELSKRFDSFMEKKQNAADVTPINEERKKILQACQDKAINNSGFFSLNVPTGGGKTLSSMAFALKHALNNGQKRIIMAIPYTSIIEQTSKVYKYGTDDDNEIEGIIKKKNGYLVRMQ